MERRDMFRASQEGSSKFSKQPEKETLFARFASAFCYTMMFIAMGFTVMLFVMGVVEIVARLLGYSNNTGRGVLGH